MPPPRHRSAATPARPPAVIGDAASFNYGNRALPAPSGNISFEYGSRASAARQPTDTQPGAAAYRSPGSILANVQGIFKQQPRQARSASTNSTGTPLGASGSTTNGPDLADKRSSPYPAPYQKRPWCHGAATSAHAEPGSGSTSFRPPPRVISVQSKLARPSCDNDLVQNKSGIATSTSRRVIRWWGPAPSAPATSAQAQHMGHQTAIIRDDKSKIPISEDLYIVHIKPNRHAYHLNANDR